ncbi:RNA-binding protein [Tepidanaerobacter syntrophicus]|uniref:Tex family protein n=1 Tax=Tepidanaerobacter syntrophicus TaxID=224999 RepID=UPI00176234FC|nr:Tex family protein [Tepidanaerobacter syntrophicus]GLI51134.1 RNA-binding protein [Tepidanaerobacter syntrophicus]HHV83857.1 RNA-binding transcriptional accessory protein [Tepidanaerobacter syntrophicus]
MEKIIKALAQELNIEERQVAAAVELLDSGNTVPFIARYRKEATGGLSDEQLRLLSDRLSYLRNLETRKTEVARLLEEMEKLTPEIRQSLDRALTLQEIEDIYRPFRPKRRTRATIAREKGLEPLAIKILSQENVVDEQFVASFVDPQKGVSTCDEALTGALDIIAETISDDAKIRKLVRDKAYKKGIIETTGLTDETSTYSMYYDFKEPVQKIVSHRILAINRGEKEKYLQVKISVPDDEIIEIIKAEYIKKSSPTSNLMENAVEDAYKRLIWPSIEREIRNMLTEEAEEQALSTFSKNLKHLILQPPVKGRIIMGFDPAYRTGCKIAIIDASGKLLACTVCYPTPPQNKFDESKKIILDLIEKYQVDVISLGNGTASRESEKFLSEILKESSRPVSYVIVSEAGASVYSASKLGTEEFPNLDVSFRGAVSIARRLQDPLAELVKIDPKSLGVGQYQHDVNQKRLSEKLSAVVEDCVNTVGVDVNTASPSLLSYVSGVSSSIALNIVKYREENGMFKSRKEFLKVPKLGPKTFEQCAGFLRVPESSNILDNTAVHPESYDIAEKIMKLYTLEELKVKTFSENDIAQMASNLDIGIPTLRDILSELKKPGRDPREELPAPIFRTDVLEISDLKPGMVLTGSVRNITDFGAFIDIGVHQDGLCHISELSDGFVRSPFDVVSVGDVVRVKVLSADKERGRISLTMKGL